MAWDPSTTVTIGNYTKASDLNSVAANADWLQQYADIGHEFDTTTPTGKHKPKFTVGYPSAIQTGENAQQVCLVMLDNPATIWDLQAFMQIARHTSWWAELGPPPIHGYLYVEEDQAGLKWWNLDTDADYGMTFTVASSNMVHSATTISKVRFLDGMIYVAGAQGMNAIDLLRDTRILWQSGNVLTYLGTVTDRNATSGHSTVNVNGPVSNVLAGVAVCRDPSLKDEFGRPRHWWGVATDSQASVFNPVTLAAKKVFDSTGLTDNLAICCTADGFLFVVDNEASRDSVRWTQIFGIAADSWVSVTNGGFFRNNAASGNGMDIPWTDSAVISTVDAIGNAAVDGGPLAFIGSDEGGILAHCSPSPESGGPGDGYKGAIVSFTADEVSPLMFGLKACAYALEGLTDVSGGGFTLTNNNSVSFATAGVHGKGATFDGTNYLTYGTSLPSVGNFGCFMLWFKSGSASNPGAVEYILEILDVTNDRWRLFANTDGTLTVQLTDDGGPTHDSLTSGGDLYDGTWHHIAAYYDIVDAEHRLMIDGKMSLNVTVSNATAAGNFDRIAIGGSYAGGSLYTGMVDQVYFGGNSSMSGVGLGPLFFKYAAWEHARGRRAMQSSVATDDALPNVGVLSAQFDERSRHIAVTTADDTLSILDEFGNIVVQDAAPAGTMRDAACWMSEDQDTPSLIMGTSTRIETVQVDRRVKD